MADDDETTSWRQYRLLIVSELERLNSGISAVNVKLDELRNDDISVMKVEIAMLKLKLGMLGFLTGTGGAVLVELAKAFIKV